MVAVLVLALVISLLANLCRQSMVRHHDGALWSRVAKSDGSIDDDSDNDGVEENISSKSVEMTQMRQSFPATVIGETKDYTNGMKGKADDDLEENATTTRKEKRPILTLVESDGRPAISELFGTIDGNLSLGLFCCVTPSLMQQILSLIHI